MFTLNWWSKQSRLIVTVVDIKASLRCTQFPLIQGFWSCCVPHELWTLYRRYIITVALVSRFVCVYVLHVFQYLHCLQQRQNCGSSKSYFSRIYSALPTAFPGSPLSVQHREKNKQPHGSWMPGNREVNIKKCYSAHQRHCSLGLWHVRCASPKEQEDIEESAIHSACCLGESLWAMSANKTVRKAEKEVVRSLLVACPQALFVLKDSLYTPVVGNPGASCCHRVEPPRLFVKSEHLPRPKRQLWLWCWNCASQYT